MGERVYESSTMERCDLVRKIRKVSLCYMGPYELLAKVGPTAYRLKLPTELNAIYDVFRIPNLTKCRSGKVKQVPLEDIQVADRLHLVEEPIEKIEGKVKQLRHNRISLGKSGGTLSKDQNIPGDGRIDSIKILSPLP